MQNSSEDNSGPADFSDPNELTEDEVNSVAGGDDDDEDIPDHGDYADDNCGDTDQDDEDADQSHADEGDDATVKRRQKRPPPDLREVGHYTTPSRPDEIENAEHYRREGGPHYAHAICVTFLPSAYKMYSTTSWTPLGRIGYFVENPRITDDRDAEDDHSIWSFIGLDGPTVRQHYPSGKSWLHKGTAHREPFVTSVTMLGLDCDRVDVSWDELCAHLATLGIQMFVHTSYNSSDGSLRVRILLPFLETFGLWADGKTCPALWKLYKQKYLTVAKMVLGKFVAEGRIKIDVSCQNPNRLLYAPARKKTGGHYLWKRFDGHLLDFGGLEVDPDALVMFLSSSAARKPRPPREKRATNGAPATFHVVALRGLELASLIDAKDEELGLGIVRSEKLYDGKVEIECPNRHQHSDPDDPHDRGCCVWNASASKAAAKGETPWANIACMHDHCRGLRAQDFLALMIEAGDFNPFWMNNPKYRLKR